MRIANHCAPALAGFKPANLISCPSATCPQAERFMEKQNRMLNSMGIFFFRLHQNEQTVLYLVYRRDCLLRSLLCEERQRALREAGFVECNQLESLLKQLQMRFQKTSFPHEVAHFLGYPPEDIRDFIRYRGKEFCLSGYWKVYHHPDQAKRFFDLYTRCRLQAIAHIRQGGCIRDLIQMDYPASSERKMHG